MLIGNLAEPCPSGVSSGVQKQGNGYLQCNKCYPVGEHGESVGGHYSKLEEMGGFPEEGEIDLDGQGLTKSKRG